MSRTVVMMALCLVSAPIAGAEVLRLACFGKQVASLDPLSPAFDPDSYTVITQIFDPLVYLDLEGKLQPGLATSWHQLEPTLWEFELRRGVRFHNGELFDSRAVVFTFNYLLDVDHNAGNAWIFSSIEAVEAVPGDPYRVRFRTKYPDGLFLARHSMFGSICPPDYFRAVGPTAFRDHPIGTGPFRFRESESGRTIELERNPDYWRKGLPQIDGLRFEILPEDTWVAAFATGRVDFLPNLAGNRTSLLMERAHGDARIIKRLVLSGYQVLIRNRGPLAQRSVRQALNHAVNKQALVHYADFGNARVLASLGKQGEFGAASGLAVYEYDPRKAARMLDEAGVTRPLRLRAIVADIAAPIARIMAFDFAQIGVELELTILSRAEWARRVVSHKLQHGTPPDFDFAINLVDNPTCDLAFHAGLFLESTSPWALLDDPEYDAHYQRALRSTQRAQHRRQFEALDRYIHDEALMIFTTQRVITAAVRQRLRVPGFALSGHLDYLMLSSARYEKRREGR